MFKKGAALNMGVGTQSAWRNSTGPHFLAATLRGVARSTDFPDRRAGKQLAPQVNSRRGDLPEFLFPSPGRSGLQHGDVGDQSIRLALGNHLSRGLVVEWLQRLTSIPQQSFVEVPTQICGCL